MIKSKVMGMLMRGKPLRDEDWRKLLAQRERLVRPKLKSIATATLGELNFSSPSLSFTFSGLVDDMESCENAEILQLRGIFGVTSRHDKAEDQGRLYAYGLHREGKWFNIELDVRDPERGRFSMRNLLIPEDFEFYDLSYRHLFNLLGNAVGSWMRRQEKRYEQTLALHRQFSLEHDLLDELESKSKKD
ncbi:hypothetical protein HZC53_00125 [Candidatus Uhrbacteria bacterium]|nr:hypothetical protein [Candidatus Uhrbacteria bacterium]